MKRQYGCGQGVRETQHGHDLSKQLLVLAVDGSQRLDATMYLRHKMSLSCVFHIIVVMVLSQVARKDNAGDVCPTNPEIQYTNIVARVHLKKPRRAFFCFFLLIIRIKYAIYDAYFQQKLYYFQYIFSSGRKHALGKTAYLPNRTCVGASLMYQIIVYIHPDFF